MSHLSREALDVAALIEGVYAADRGAVVTFSGRVRNDHASRAVIQLEYSAYEPMAESCCAAIVVAAAGRWPVSVDLAHRLGTLQVGDEAVLVVVAGRHRDEAFEACRWVIDEVKRRVPIWKREHYADGSAEWVDPTASAAAAASAGKPAT